MNDEKNQAAKNMLEALYQRTQGNPEQTVSMYELGASLGLAKGAAGAAAEELMVDGLAELRTLAGGIGITAEGLAALGIAPVSAEASPATGRRMSRGPLLDGDDRELIEHLLSELRRRPPTGKTLGEFEDIVFDLKTLEVQLLSPAAKTAIVREVLCSLHAAFHKQGDTTASTRLQELLG